LARPTAILFDLKAAYRLSSRLTVGGLVKEAQTIAEIESILGRYCQSNAEVVSGGLPLKIVARTNTVPIREALGNRDL
jgi:hypothetical protein